MTLKEIAARHLDADSWADEAMMLAALREAVEECAKICEQYDPTKRETLPIYIAAALREAAEGKP